MSCTVDGCLLCEKGFGAAGASALDFNADPLADVILGAGCPFGFATGLEFACLSEEEDGTDDAGLPPSCIMRFFTIPRMSSSSTSILVDDEVEVCKSVDVSVLFSSRTLTCFESTSEYQTQSVSMYSIKAELKGMIPSCALPPMHTFRCLSASPRHHQNAPAWHALIVTVPLP